MAKAIEFGAGDNRLLITEVTEGDIISHMSDRENVELLRKEMWGRTKMYIKASFLCRVKRCFMLLIRGWCYLD